MTNFHEKNYLQTSLLPKNGFLQESLIKKKITSLLSIYNDIYLFNIFNNSNDNVIKRVLGVKTMKNSAKQEKKQVAN